jgi:predicted DNA-binding WGR domain protein
MNIKAVSLNWHNIDPTTNKRRWYHLHTSKDLWGHSIVICRWGRIGGQQQEQIYWYSSRDELKMIIQHKVHKRKLHGYSALG